MMLEIFKSKWRNRWHVYDVDTGGTVWVASFRHEEDAMAWVRAFYNDDQ